MSYSPVVKRLGRRAILASPAVLLLAATTACSPVQVTTTEAPDAHLSHLRTFVIATPSRRRADAVGTSNEPMLSNSISNRALRQDLASEFVAKGYIADSASPTFTVAYYASAQQKLDVTDYDYGYQFGGMHRWWHGSPGYTEQEVRQYTEGTVIVDVIDPVTKELLWRGQGKAEVSDDPTAYSADIARTVTAIVAQFPIASGA